MRKFGTIGPLPSWTTHVLGKNDFPILSQLLHSFVFFLKWDLMGRFQTIVNIMLFFYGQHTICQKNWLYQMVFPKKNNLMVLTSLYLLLFLISWYFPIYSTGILIFILYYIYVFYCSSSSDYRSLPMWAMYCRLLG